MSKSTRHSCRKRQIEVEDRIEIMKVEKWYSSFHLYWKNGGNEKFFESWKKQGILLESQEKSGNFAPVREKLWKI